MLENLPNPRKSSAANQERISFRAECESQSIRLFYPDEIEQHLRDIFDEDKDQCVYCGEDDFKKLTWDHLVPVTPPKTNERDKIGHLVTGNLVPACSSCNSSKGNKDFEEWMRYCKGKKPKSIRKKGDDFVNDRISKLQCYRDVQAGSYDEFRKKRGILDENKSEINKKIKKISQLREDLKCELKNLEDFTKRILD